MTENFIAFFIAGVLIGVAATLHITETWHTPVEEPFREVMVCPQCGAMCYTVPIFDSKGQHSGKMKPYCKNRCMEKKNE